MRFPKTQFFVANFYHIYYFYRIFTAVFGMFHGILRQYQPFSFEKNIIIFSLFSGLFDIFIYFQSSFFGGGVWCSEIFSALFLFFF